MDIIQKQNMVQSLRQEQVMTHQQIQALEMLFLPVLELQTMIDAEIEKNPVLDTEEPHDVDLPEISDDSDDWIEKILKLDEENRYIKSKPASRNTQEDEEKRKHYLESITSEKTFQELLIEQLRFLDLDPETYSCCEAVISGLDDDAYLTSHPADLAMASGKSLELIGRAIETVQKLDPPGVAAANLKERLLLQLERKGKKDSITYRAVEEHLDDIAANHLPQVARKLKITLDELKEIIREIQGLNPRLVTEEVSPHEYVQPEVEIFEDEKSGELRVKVLNEYLPSLYISRQYKDLLKDPSTPKETRDYIKEKLHSGVFLINSIIQRQSTIKRIANAIAEFQKDFFLKGTEHMKPLTMAKIAEIVGIHETTVSRAVAGKHAKCKYGLLPLRHFFSTGYESEDGTSVSKNVVKNAIKRIIDTEDPFSPMSDSQIVEQLREEGFKVARRTVAKYRESMNILPSNLRRQY